MNDRYLFRGKDRNDGNWSIGFLTADRFGTNEEQYFITDKITGYHAPVTTKSVGQCTGLKDKNGKLIFEGDIVLLVDADGEKTRCKVQWSEKYAGYVIAMRNDAVDTIECWNEYNQYFEIIGNVSDNPELLEVKE